MKVAINGIGIAGPTFAWWLKKYGHEPVLFEKAPKLRTGGYVIDFWGVGYDIAEKMDILPSLHEKGYKVENLKVVGKEGEIKARMDMKGLAKVVNNRFISIERSGLSAAIYDALDDVESHFGTSIIDIKNEDNGVVAKLSNGKSEEFDLVVGADGLHSKVREVTFGPEEKFEKFLDYWVAAFELTNYKKRDELTYIMHTVPKKQVARFSMRNNKTLFLFIFSSEFVKKVPKNETEEKEALREVFKDFEWEVPEILERMKEVEDIYFDKVSQIHMDSWSKGRVTLVGDAAACVSLLAGEGAGIAMAESYVLAGEIEKSKGNYKKAFQNYEKFLMPFTKKKQKDALRFAGFFAPKNKLGLSMRNLGIKLSSNPFFANLLVGRSLRDDIDLPNYSSLQE